MSTFESGLSPERQAAIELILKRKGLTAPAASRIPRRTDRGPCPLTFAQQRLWFLWQLDPGNAFYNVVLAAWLDGAIEPERLHQAFDRLRHRHAALRARFVDVNGRPFQEVDPRAPLSYACIDLGSLPLEQAEREAERLAGAEARTPFDVAQPPWRVRVIRVRPDRHGLCVTMHHIISDGWSISVLIRDTMALYVNPREDALPALAVQFDDVAAWQNGWLTDERLEQDIQYWRTRLRGTLPMLELPADYERPEHQRFVGTWERRTFGPSVMAAVTALCASRKVTLFTVLTAAFKAVLHRLSGQTDLVLGTAVAGRERVELEGLIGCFANTLVLRTDLSGDPSFDDLLARVAETLSGAFQHQNVPFERLVELLRPDRSLSHNPLVQAMCVLQNVETVFTEGRPQAFDDGLLTMRSLSTVTHTARFDLELHCWNNPSEFGASAVYNTDLFDRETIEALLDSLESVLADAAAHPGKRLSELRLRALAAPTRVAETNIGDDAAADLTASLVSAIAARGERAAIVPDGADLVTGTALAGRVLEISAWLLDQRIDPERPVVIRVKPSRESVAAICALIETGTPFALMDAAESPSRVAAVARAIGTDIVLTDESTHASDAIELDGVRTIVLPDRLTRDGAGARRERRQRKPHQRKPHQQEESRRTPRDTRARPNVVCFDCSCAQPRPLRRHDLIQRVRSAHDRLSLGPDDVVLHASSPTLDGWIEEVLAPLLAGACICPAPGGTLQDDTLYEAIARSNATVAVLAPASLARLEASAERHVPPPRLRAVLTLGGRLGSAAAARAARTLGCEVYAGYIHPATGALAALHRADGEAVARTKPAWRLCQPSRWLVRDAHGAQVPLNGAGWLSSIDEPEDAAPRGDRVRARRDGAVELLDGPGYAYRGAARVETLPVEKAVRDVPGVRDAVIAVKDPGGRAEALVAFIVAHHAVSAAELEAAMARVCPRAFVPDLFVAIDTVPLTATGAVDVDALMRLPVLDAAIIQDWRRACEVATPPSALIVTEEAAAPPVLHLSEVIDDWRTMTRSVQAAQVASAPAAPEVRTSGKPLAILHGEPLVFTADHPATLADALSRAAATARERDITYITANGETHESYAGLLLRARRVAAGLAAAGLASGDRVLFQLDDQPAFLAAFWGCVLAGVVPVPVTVPTTYSEAQRAAVRVRQAWEKLGRPPIITDASTEAGLRSSQPLFADGELRLLSIRALAEATPVARPTSRAPGDIALLLLTSGSTGGPKVVVHTHRTLLSRSAANQQRHGFSPDDVSINWMPLDHVGGLVMFHLMDVYVCARQVQAPTALVLQDPLRWLDWIERYRATITWAPNFAFGLINSHAREIAARPRDLSSMRFILNGGEAIVPATARTFMGLLAPHGLPPFAMRPAWGMSETSSGVTYAADFASSDPAATFASVGAPIPGMSVRVVDIRGEIVPEGTAGRLQVHGAAVSLGYLDDPAHNAEAFQPDGWFDTGDLAILERGSLSIVGRTKDVIIVNGVNVYSHEIESLVEQCEGVTPSFTAACAVRDDGDDTDQIAVFFHTARQGVEKARLLEEIRSRVTRSAGFAPRYLVPVPQDAIPKTSIGKMQRSELAAELRRGVFDEVLADVDLLSRTNTIPEWGFAPVYVRKQLAQDFAAAGARAVVVLLGSSRAVDTLRASAPREAIVIAVRSGTTFEKRQAMEYAIDDTDGEHFARLVEHVRGDHGPIAVVVWVGARDVDRGDGALMSPSEETAARAIALVRGSVRAQAQGGPARLVFLHASPAGTRPSAAHAAEAGMLAAFVRSGMAEHPELQLRLVEIDAIDTADRRAALWPELLSESNDPEVRYRDGARLVPRLRPVSLKAPRASGPAAFERDGFYLVAGGGGGIAEAIAARLVDRFGVRLLMVGRTPATRESAEARAGEKDPFLTWRADDRFADRIAYEAVDVCDAPALEDAVSRAEARWGTRLKGILHLAGTYDDRPLADEDVAHVAGILRAKTLGTAVLAATLAKRDRRGLFVCFSSVNAYFGGFGAAAYSAASRAQAELSRLYRSEGLRSCCIGWAAWSGIGMSRRRATAAAERSAGFQSISVPEGFASLIAALRLDEPYVLMGVDAASRRVLAERDGAVSALQRVRIFTTDGAAPPVALRDRFGTPIQAELTSVDILPRTPSGAIDADVLRGTDTNGHGSRGVHAEPLTEQERRIAGIFREILRVPRVGATDNFFTLGGHSLLATQLVSRLRVAFNREIPLRLLFTAATPRELAAEIDRADGSPRPIAALALERPARVPLSFAQQRLWFLSQLAPESLAYHVALAVELRGALSITALRRAITEVIHRHEALRTAFRTTADGEPYQDVLPHVHVPLPIVDVSEPGVDRGGSEVSRVLRVVESTPLRLDAAPLLRFVLLRIAPDVHVVGATLHHAICDGWSLGVLFEELAALYRRFAERPASPLPALAELSYQYPDFAVSQRAHLQGEVLARHLDFWKQQLGEELPDLRLPWDRPRPAKPSGRGARVETCVDGALLADLRGFAAAEQSTLFMLLLASYQSLLHRCSGQDAVVTGAPIANRTRTELEPLIGFFVNTLALRTSFAGAPTFRDVVRQVRTNVLAAYEHQDLPFEMIVEEIQPRRDPGRSPIFQVSLTVQNTPAPVLEAAGLQMRQLAPRAETVRFDLEMHAGEYDDALEIVFIYSTDLFEQSTIERFSRQWMTLLEGALTTPDRAVRELALWSEVDARALTVSRSSRMPETAPRGLASLFEEQAARADDAEAVRCGDRAMTYRELNQAANRLAHALLSHGAGPDVRVGVLLDRSLDLIVVQLAIVKAGAAYVPLDPSWPAHRIATLIDDAGVALMVVNAGTNGMVPRHAIVEIDLDADDESIAAQPDTNPVVDTSPDNLAYVMYTSGSTGKPKGVAVTQRGVLRLVTRTNYVTLGPEDVVMQFAPATFDASTFEIWGALLNGCRLAVVPPGVPALADLARFIETEAVTTLWLTAPLFHRLVEAHASCLTSVRQVLAGGDVVSAGAVQRLFDSGFRGALINGYGPTENTTFSACHVMRGAPAFATSVPIGRAISGTTTFVCDRAGARVPPGIVGELYVGGDGLARAYLNAPALTADRFVPDEMSGVPGQRLYRTGDLVRERENGELEYLGRVDRQVKVRGHRVEIGEIEAALRDQPGVRDVAIVARPEPDTGVRLLAYVVADDGVDLEDVRTALEARLPAFMLPALWIRLDRLPLTPSGKLDRHALPVPGPERPDTAGPYAGPEGRIEERLAEIWRDVLRLTRVGRHDNFFRLGGDSILSIQVVARAHRAGLMVTPEQIFEHQTIAALAAVARKTRDTDEEGDEEGSPLATLTLAQRRTLRTEVPAFADVYGLSPLQQGLLYHTVSGAEHDAYFVQMSGRLEGPLAVDALRAAWEWTVERHEALRSSVHWEGLDTPVQVVWKQVTLPWTMLDWRSVPVHAQAARLTALEAADRARGFALTEAPLQRWTLVRLADTTWQLIWSHHHLMLDGWSVARVLEDVWSAYDALHETGAPPDRPAPRPYRAYIDWLARQDRDAASDYWRKQLGDVDEPARVRVAAPGGPSTTAQRDRSLDAGASGALEALARRHEVTLNTIVQGSWALLLSRYSGRRDVVFGATVAGRPTDLAGVETMVGLFINTLPVRVRIDDQAEVGQWLAGLQRAQAEARQYAYSPLADVQRLTAIPRGTPLFDTLLVFENYPRSVLSAARDTALRIPRMGWFERSNYALTASASADGRLHLKIVYDQSRYSDATIEALIEHWTMLLEAFARAEAATLGGLPQLPRLAERQLLEWADGGASTPAPDVIDALERQARIRPDAVAVESDSRTLRYGALNERANHVARMLRERGVGVDDPVGVCLPRTVDLFVAIWGIWKAGAAYVPLDPMYPAERLRYMIRDSRVRIVISHPSTASALESADGWELLDVDTIAHTPPADTAPVTGQPLPSDRLAYIIYTSGSSGEPKGVGISAASLSQRLAACVERYGVSDSDVVSCLAPASFDIFLFESMMVICAGGRCLLAPRDGGVDPERVGPLLARSTIVHAVPSLMTHLVFSLGPDVRWIFTGGEAVPPPLVARLRRAAPGAEVVVLYGPTETTMIVTDRRSARGGDPSAHEIGWPLAHVRAYVCDERGDPRPVGVDGELVIGGEGLARGYLGQPGLTASRFVPDHLSGAPGARLYRTGDLVRWRESGELEYLGRLDRQVKVRGHRVELGEIEAALAAQPGVREIAVVPHHAPGEDVRLAAYAVVDDSTTLADVRTAIEARLPHYMVPSLWVRLDQMPLTPNGKLDTRALPEPGPERPEMAGRFVAPEGALEILLAKIWRDVLRLERVGRHDNFFALGGDSILSLQVVARARRAGVTIALEQLFEQPTIAAIAASCRDATSTTPAAAPAATPAGEWEPVPLTPIQAWFFAHAWQRPWHFNQSLLLVRDGALDPRYVRAAVHAIARHQEAFGLRYRSTPDGWEQRVASGRDAGVWTVVDLRGLDETAADRALSETVAAANASLDLEHGPIARVVWIERGGAGRDRLLIVVHHLAIDGVSWRILLDDLDFAYDCARRGDAIALAPATPYSRWANELQQLAASPAADEWRAYWTERGDPDPGVIPRDHPATADDDLVRHARTVSGTLSDAATRRLLQAGGRAEGGQVQELLLAALAESLRDWTGRVDPVWITVERHGRDAVPDGPDLSRTVGWFTVQYPLRLEPEGRGSGAWLRGVRRAWRETPLRGSSYGLLRYLAPVDRQLPGGPPTPVAFNYLGQFDQVLGGASRWQPATEGSGPNQWDGERRPAMFDVSAWVVDGCLQVNWTYGITSHRAETARRLLDGYLLAIERSIEQVQDIMAGADAAEGEADEAAATLATLATLTPAQRERLRTDVPALADVYGLSPLQHGLLYHAVSGAGHDPYVVQLSARLEGALAVDALRAAWEWTVARHEALRSSVHWEGLDTPVQVVWGQVTLPWTVLDWRSVPEEARAARLTALEAADRARGFVLTEAPLQRWTLVRLTDTAWQLIWSHHHLLLDGWSVARVLEDVWAAYDAFHETGAPPAARPSPRPYRAYIDWLARQDRETARRYWREQLGAIDEPALLPIPASSGQSPDPATLERSLDASATGALETLARRHGVTLNTVVQAAWALVLGHYCGRRDVVFGATVAGRPPDLAEVETMVGLFINTVPVRVRIDEQAEVGQWLARLQRAQAEARRYAYSPLADIQQLSAAPRGAPLFDTLLVFENYPARSASVGPRDGVRLSHFESRQGSNLPFGLAIEPRSQLTVSAFYEAARVPPALATRLLEATIAALGELPRHQNGRVRDVAVMSDAERGQLLAWSAAEDGRVVDPISVLESTAACRPDAPAVLDGDRVLSYRDVNAAANRLARYLGAARIGPGDRVAVCLESSSELIVTLLAIWKAGAAYVPVGVNQPRDRIEWMLRETGASLVISRTAIDTRTPLLALDRASEPLAREASEDLPGMYEPDALAAIYFTSGSSGAPKGVMVTRRSAAWLSTTDAALLGISAGSRVLQFAAPTFDASLWEIFGAIVAGASLVTVAPSDARDPERLHEVLVKHRVTVATLPPTMLRRVREDGLDALTTVVSAGEPCTADIVSRWSAGRTLINAYGPTEATVCATAGALVEPDDANVVGRPIAGAEVFLLDDRLCLAPVGAIGEICIGGAGVSRGYWGAPALTAQHFVPHPFSARAGERLYRTGDRGRLREDGRLEYAGRTDAQVKIRGVRIELEEVAAAVRRHPGVHDCVVVAAPHGDGEPLLAACYVPSDAALSPGDLRAFVQRSLPDVMIPARFVAIDEVPLTRHGKIDRVALGRAIDRPAVVSIAPRTDTERVLAELWKAVLSLEHVGMTDDFFALGGHSISATQLTSRVRAAWGIDLPVLAVFSSPTIELLAQRVELLRLQAAADDELLAALHDMDGLSDAEAERLLAPDAEP